MADEHKKAADEAAVKVAAAATDERDKIVGDTRPEPAPAAPRASNGEGLWQKLFMGLLSLVFAVLAGAYVKLANDVSITSAAASKALDATTRIEERLRVMDVADNEAEVAERNRLQKAVEELERQRRRDDLETP